MVTGTAPRLRGGRKGRPPKIAREQIISAALELGIRDLTLASIAQRLGVTLQALYHYVNDRDQLAEIVAEEIVSHYPLPVDDATDWAEWAVTFAHSQLSMFQSFPGLAQLAMRRTVPAAIARLELSVMIARRSGFDLTRAWWVTRAVQEFVFSWATREEIRQVALDKAGVSYHASLLGVIDKTPGGAPNLRAAVEEIGEGREMDRFEYTLRALIAGLAMQRLTSS